ncbi:SLC13 family permease [Mangrovibacterium diazotrophicum]|uniref:Citrate transporter n=1 Tax=Mangrovibacterium diazotrophicum TaxID=1261403 RepID=A0A419VYN1_9BACT|nr:SLC13 family permease [Mangrovibacterium diazotrophicum]RKD88338.1 citrate transporter [Mangrovibacterium diazotrophicum]
MTFEGYFVLGVIIIMIVALIYDLMRPGLLLFSALMVLMATGVINTEESLAGFSNKGMLTVAVLFLVSEGVRQTGALNILGRAFLPKRRGKLPFTLPRILLPVSVLSAFLNNTPVVIIFAPMIKNWAERMNLSPQKFLIPLSYATILGGMCTLIGTSTNLVVHGLMLENGLPGLNMFELGKVGIWVAIVGFLYMSVIGHKILPGEKNNLRRSRNDYKEYFLDATLPDNSALIGEEINNGRTHTIKNIIIHSVERNGEIIDSRKGKFTLESTDKLVIAVKSDSLIPLITHKQIELKAMKGFGKFYKSTDIKQIEAVIAPRFPGINQTIDEFDFLNHYQAEVLAVYRNGETISTNVGSVRMKDGDSLVLLTNENFIRNWGESKIFYLTSFIGEIPPPRYKGQRLIALLLVLLMIVGATVGKYLPEINGAKPDMFYFAALVACIMTWINIMPNRKYTKVISWDVLITIACAFGISKALQNSGAADSIALTAINFSKSWGPIGVLITIYLITTIFTEVITNNAAAALVFPIAFAAAEQLHVDPKPFFITICIAASASFATPIGYQTNLLVQGLGNYKFIDYTKVGLPLNIIAFIISITLVPILWPF